MVDQSLHAEDAPETPAPQFAIRALKSAFLGTPQTKQPNRTGRQHVSPVKNLSIDLQPESANLGGSPKKEIRSLRNDALLSPTKGILLTPGTAATKRKTVSFGNFEVNEKARINLFTGQPTTSANNGPATANPAISDDQPVDRKAQPILTKSDFESQLEVSKRRMGKPLPTQEPPADTKPGEVFGTTDPSITNDGRLREARRDTTVDLNLPCSRSGKHWKGEYDQYHRKSNREMRRLIQHGQTIKSYAQKKDWEAAGLHEKLNKELAKVAAMETKVSKLAGELANIRSHGAQGNVDPEQLVNDLAKRTATAIKSKQKVEEYRAALEEHNETKMSHSNNDDDCVQITLPEPSKPTEKELESSELILLRSELVSFQSTVKDAESKAAKLEGENSALKQKMARLKAEMQSYEQRRLAREERIVRKQTKLLAAKEETDTKYEQLKVEHERLRHTHRTAAAESVSDNLNPTQSNTGRTKKRIVTEERLNQAISDNSHLGRHRQQHAKSLAERHAALGPQRSSDISQEGPKNPTSARSRSPLVQSRESNEQLGRSEESKANQAKHTTIHAPKETGIDIWTYAPEGSLIDATLPSSSPPQSPESTQLRTSTYTALQEISENSLIEPQALTSPPPSTLPNSPAPQKPALHSAATRRMHSRRSTLASPRPSFLSMVSSAQKPEPQRFVPDSSGVGGDRRSFLSAGTRKSLPPDRAEAARKRLDAKRRENKVGGESGKGGAV